MSQHLFATIVTSTAVAANNRGEGDGSTLSTLQKLPVATINTRL
jgi:CRISPR-associated protein Cst2